MNVNYMEKVSGNKWSDIFEDEAELIESMMKVDASNKLPAYKMVKGYVYVSSFQRTIKAGNNLSDKQMVQLKRLAISIFKAGKAQKIW